MSKFLNNLAEKAQAAMNSTTLGQSISNRIPGGQPPQHQDPYAPISPELNTSPPPTTGQADHTAGAAPQGVTGILKQHGLSSIHNSLRALQAQYSKGDDKQVQLVIIAQKSLVLEYDNIGRDSKTYGKELYLWGQEQTDDLKDVSDRLAYLNFVQGKASSELSAKLDTARGPFKNARNAEAALVPRRNQRSNIETQLSRLSTEIESGRPTPSIHGRIAELEKQRATLQREDEPQERELETLKRTALKESELARWAAIREYAEKLILLSQAAEALVAEIPASASDPYAGKQRTASIRHTVQQSMDNFHPGNFSSPFVLSSAFGESLDSRSFGETHQSELEHTPSIKDKHKEGGETPLPYHPSYGGADLGPGGRRLSSGGVDPASLNNAPAPIQVSNASHAAVPLPPSSPTPVDPISSVTSTPLPGGPTVAEAGVPLRGGPGPVSGSLNRQASATQPQQEQGKRSWSGPGAGGVGGFSESPYEEKKRLEKQQSSSLPPIPGGSSHPSAEEEKRKLAKEEKERDAISGASLKESSHPTTEETGRLAAAERERILAANEPRRDGVDDAEKGVPPPYED